MWRNKQIEVEFGIGAGKLDVEWTGCGIGMKSINYCLKYLHVLSVEKSSKNIHIFIEWIKPVKDLET
jgi:hypothetical protein